MYEKYVAQCQELSKGRLSVLLLLLSQNSTRPGTPHFREQSRSPEGNFPGGYNGSVGYQELQLYLLKLNFVIGIILEMEKPWR